MNFIRGEMDMSLLMARYGEIALKGKNQHMFTRQLRRNIRVALRENGLQGDVYEEDRRIYIRTDEPEKAIPHLQRVFGIVSLSTVVEVERDVEAMRAEALRMAAQFGLGPAHTYRTEARRADKTFPYPSPEINRIVGGAVKEATGAIVKLKGPADFIIGIEVRRDRVLMYGDIIPGPGGLPVPVSGRVVALISGGIDSPVAAWMMMKRGCGVIPLHFSQNSIETEKALRNCEVLARYSYGWKMRPIILSYEEAIGPTLRGLDDLDAGRWACLFCKRAMLWHAQRIAEEHHAQAIVIGDSIGQVASQTLDNIELISWGIQKPILRPLVGLDKVEITDLARRIGTFDISTQYAEPCAFLPAHPITRGTKEQFFRILEQLEDVKRPDL